MVRSIKGRSNAGDGPRVKNLLIIIFIFTIAFYWIGTSDADKVEHALNSQRITERPRIQPSPISQNEIKPPSIENMFSPELGSEQSNRIIDVTERKIHYCGEDVACLMSLNDNSLKNAAESVIEHCTNLEKQAKNECGEWLYSRLPYLRPDLQFLLCRKILLGEAHSLAEGHKRRVRCYNAFNDALARLAQKYPDQAIVLIKKQEFYSPIYYTYSCARARTHDPEHSCPAHNSVGNSIVARNIAERELERAIGICMDIGDNLFSWQITNTDSLRDFINRMHGTQETDETVVIEWSGNSTIHSEYKDESVNLTLDINNKLVHINSSSKGEWDIDVRLENNSWIGFTTDTEPLVDCIIGVATVLRVNNITSASYTCRHLEVEYHREKCLEKIIDNLTINNYQNMIEICNEDSLVSDYCLERLSREILPFNVEAAYKICNDIKDSYYKDICIWQSVRYNAEMGSNDIYELHVRCMQIESNDTRARCMNKVASLSVEIDLVFAEKICDEYAGLTSSDCVVDLVKKYSHIAVNDSNRALAFLERSKQSRYYAIIIARNIASEEINLAVYICSKYQSEGQLRANCIRDVAEEIAPVNRTRAIDVCRELNSTDEVDFCLSYIISK